MKNLLIIVFGLVMALGVQSRADCPLTLQELNTIPPEWLLYNSSAPIYHFYTVDDALVFIQNHFPGQCINIVPLPPTPPPAPPVPTPTPLMHQQ